MSILKSTDYSLVPEITRGGTLNQSPLPILFRVTEWQCESPKQSPMSLLVFDDQFLLVEVHVVIPGEDQGHVQDERNM